MIKNFFLLILFIIILFPVKKAFSQDVEFHLNSHLFIGKKILKIKRDFYDPYLWVLAQNNQVYRVNSLTLAIDDYTAVFSAYSSYQFIDIAGRSKDTVFIATNSPNIIEYKTGAVKLIGAADGIAGVVNEIGIDYLGNYLTDNTRGLGTRPSANTLLIATNSGMCHYDYQNDIIVAGSSHVPSRVFEATYRTEMFSNVEFGTYNDVFLQYPVIDFTKFTVYGGFLYYGAAGGFGNNINTAYYTSGYQYDFSYNFVLFANQFWGTENGLFQNSWDYSYQSSSGYIQYLNGINVNKVTSIYGLVNFGHNLIRENLLVGTINGLYFTNNKYSKQGYIDKNNAYTMFHYDQMGNIAVNDICVNATSYTTPICEDGAWVAADDGLYLIKPDYTSYLSSSVLQAIRFQKQSDTVSTIKVCAGDSVSAVINTFAYTGNTFQWYKDGVELAAQSRGTLIIKAAGDYYAVLYDPCSNIHMESNHLKVTVISGPVFSFNYPDTIQQCVGVPYTLKLDNKSGYHYRWYANGVLNGDTTSTLAVTQTGKYKAEVSVCTNSWVPTKEVAVRLITLPIPVITADKPIYCEGDRATLSTGVFANPAYVINWYKDNVLLAGAVNQVSITTNNAGDYTVSVVNIAANTDGSLCSHISAVQPLVFNAMPTVSIEKIVKTTLCEGQIVDLLAHYNGGTIKWSTGETTDQISVASAGNYKVTVISSAGCQADTSISISFLPNPVLNLKDTSICTYKHQTITLTAPAGYSQYAWNGAAGEQTYLISNPQTVNLTVTDSNGCQATQSINVIDQCPNIWIANTFTPNGDGINDTWKIEGVDKDPSATVKVFNRYGQLIFDDKGYTVPWSGIYHGKKLPPGVYYYIIIARNGTQKFTGSVTIIY